MKIFKFGGASVKDATGVRNLHAILSLYPDTELVVIISAMGKTTNALEKLVNARFENGDWKPALEEVCQFHLTIVNDLQPELPFNFGESLKTLLAELEQQVQMAPDADYDQLYDQIIGYGEIFSTHIVAAYLQAREMDCYLADARKLIRTNSNYRNAQVNWPESEKLISACWNSLPMRPRVVVCQGFIGHDADGSTTSLGREGSDYSAAVFAHCLNASEVVIWKDVPGMLNADPKQFPDAVLLNRISFTEAIELAYYGASVIHPKTIKPLENKEIPLYVKSFLNPQAAGTLIQKNTFSDALIPSFILKPDQVLISITPQDFSFITESDLQQIFGVFAMLKMQVNLMQNSAISFSVCLDFQQQKFRQFLKALEGQYRIKYNHPCELLTIRHYHSEIIARLSSGKKVLLDQRSRETARLVLA